MGFAIAKAADHNNGNDDEDRQIEFVYSFVVAGRCCVQYYYYLCTHKNGFNIVCSPRSVLNRKK